MSIITDNKRDNNLHCPLSSHIPLRTLILQAQPCSKEHFLLDLTMKMIMFAATTNICVLKFGRDVLCFTAPLCDTLNCSGPAQKDEALSGFLRHMLVKDTLLFLQLMSVIGRRILRFAFYPTWIRLLCQTVKEKVDDLFMQGESKRLPPNITV